ncbi:hypothetical protein AUJ66_07000 [Candidatus Desantisbacteria bacterium CG1_02_38_46]|uniref:Thiamine-monophosphate kinase n=2 Tax=unclassified Candidatus Desantisiibacteriota TaxID=3106372 RepID=A0A2H9PBJ7_9BACT|nr:MAG: hypothetical protein AUJ66_07000 [Candidatus Desantisbacteria bacterium CG1_02_38_46]PIZ15169.1 MAG: hypothetical protein COY51_06155 [Candidatus Desantisbacteria bacterium CG_4_10_14_0_8_um_filter_39_17]
MKIKKLGEFGLIEHIRRHFTSYTSSPRGTHVLRGSGTRLTQNFIGIGDDTAVIKISSKKYLLWTTDILIESIHFLPKHLSLLPFRFRLSPTFMLGWKALAVNLSDIAAMGGIPQYALVTLGLKGNEDVKFVDELYRGMKSCSGRARYDCSGRPWSAEKSSKLDHYSSGRPWSAVKILGGDTTKSPILVIDVSVIGEVEKKNLVLRRGASPGDVICVTGFCGDSAVGLAILRRGSIHRAHCSGTTHPSGGCPGSANERHLICRHLMPTPRLKEARIIAKNHLATSMIDNSDGLLASVKFLCQSSGVGAKIYEDKIPISKQLIKGLFHPPRAEGLSYCRSGRVHSAIQKFALTGGEDYELVFTVPPQKLNDVLTKIPELTGTPVTAIGEVTKNKGIFVCNSSGKRKNIKNMGFDHFV